MAHYYSQRMEKRASGSNAGRRDDPSNVQATAWPEPAGRASIYRGPPSGERPRIIGNPNRRGQSFRGGRSRGTRRGVSFGGREGVYVTTHISNAPPNGEEDNELLDDGPNAKPSWAAKDPEDSESSEN